MDHSFSTALEIWGIPFGVGLAALTGSLHCTLMCGPLVSAVAPRAQDWLTYQLGRTVSYTALGALAGGLSSGISRLLSGVQFFERGYALLLSLVLVVWGIQQWRGKALKIPGMHWLSNLGRRKLPQRTLVVGFFSALLPCGYLHGFVIGAFATQSALRGAIVMLLFALGSAPGLFGAPVLARALRAPLARFSQLRAHFHQVSAVLLVLSGLWSAVVFSGLLSHSGHGGSSEPSQRQHHGHHH